MTEPINSVKKAYLEHHGLKPISYRNALKRLNLVSLFNDFFKYEPIVEVDWLEHDIDAYNPSQ